MRKSIEMHILPKVILGHCVCTVAKPAHQTDHADVNLAADDESLILASVSSKPSQSWRRKHCYGRAVSCSVEGPSRSLTETSGVG